MAFSLLHSAVHASTIRTTSVLQANCFTTTILNVKIMIKKEPQEYKLINNSSPIQLVPSSSQGRKNRKYQTIVKKNLYFLFSSWKATWEQKQQCEKKHWWCPFHFHMFSFSLQNKKQDQAPWAIIMKNM